MYFQMLFSFATSILPLFGQEPVNILGSSIAMSPWFPDPLAASKTTYSQNNPNNQSSGQSWEFYKFYKNTSLWFHIVILFICYEQKYEWLWSPNQVPTLYADPPRMETCPNCQPVPCSPDKLQIGVPKPLDVFLYTLREPICCPCML